MVQSGQPKPARRLGRSRRVGVPPRTHAFCPQVIKTKSSRKNCCCCGNSFFFWTNGTASNRGEGRGQHNVMETADFAGKPFPCPVCNVSLRLKISSKQKPYCMCLECGIQIFFRGQAGIQRLWQVIQSEEAVAAEFNGPARALSLYNRLQGAFDECAATAEIKKGKYVYCHCTGYRGKCDLPFIREEVVGENLGQILKNIHIPDDLLHQLQNSLREDSKQVREETAAQRTRLEQCLSVVRRRMERAYVHKLDGKISEGSAKHAEWQEEANG